jgi:VanZ family protein
VAELQPWQHTRKLPLQTAAELDPEAEGALVRFLRAWWPALFWAVLIFSLSMDTFSAEHTASVLERVVGWLHLKLSDDQFTVLHFFIRKCAHFTEYFIFCILVFRGIRGQRKGWRWLWGLSAWLAAAGYSAMDEIHQAFVSSRTASVYDSLLDSVGALVALIALYLYFRRPLWHPRERNPD